MSAPPIWSAMQKLLSDDATFAGIATGGVHHNAAPDNISKPFTVIRAPSVSPYKSLSGIASSAKSDIDIVHYANGSAKDIADSMFRQARSVLAGYGPATVTIGADSIFISSINEEDTQADAVKEPDGSDLPMNAVVQRFTASHEI